MVDAPLPAGIALKDHKKDRIPILPLHGIDANPQICFAFYWNNFEGFPILVSMDGVRIDSPTVADLRHLAEAGDSAALSRLSVSGVSIGAAVELACLYAAMPLQLRNVCDKWKASSTLLEKAFGAYESVELPSKLDMWASRALEFFPIRGPSWSDPIRYHPFESRFRKAAADAGFGKKSVALAGALFEMADNVVQHGGNDSGSPPPGLIGYYICDGHVSFAIGDAGRGVLNSLRENPVWTGLENSKNALIAVVQNHASRRSMGGEGEGFKELFRALANLNGLIQLRSGDGRIKISQIPAGRQAESQFTIPGPGLQLSVNCSLSGQPREEIFPLDYLT